MKRERQVSEQTEKFFFHSTPVQELKDSPTQKLDAVGSELKDMFGKACRDCINLDLHMSLSRDDCKYDRNPDGHRKIGICAFCGRKRPIVQGVKLASRIRMRFS